MTSTLGVWMLTGYGAEKAPHLMQLSVHCDHLRSVLFWRACPSPLRRNGGCFDHPVPKKRCAPQYTSTGEGETFMVCQLFSPYGEKEAVLFGCFQKHFSNIRPRKRAKVRRFSKKILKTDLLPYGETWAVLTSVFQTFSSLSAIRRKTCCFDQVFSQNFFCFLHHTEKRMPFC